MQKTLDMAQQSFQDENSLMYRLTSMYFSYQVRQRQQRDREAMRERQSERRTQRRLREQERAEVLAAFGQPLIEPQAPQTNEREAQNFG